MLGYRYPCLPCRSSGSRRRASCRGRTSSTAGSSCSTSRSPPTSARRSRSRRSPDRSSTGSAIGWPRGSTTTTTSSTRRSRTTAGSCSRRRPSTARVPRWSTEELVRQVGPIDCICTHVDLDGLYAAAKWVLGGKPPYPTADADARAVDTRVGEPGPIAVRIDRALRARVPRRPAQARGRAVPRRRHAAGRARRRHLRRRRGVRASLRPHPRPRQALRRARPGRGRRHRGRDRPVRQDRPAAGRAGPRGRLDRARLRDADDRRAVRERLGLRQDVRARRRHADAGDDPRRRHRGGTEEDRGGAAAGAARRGRVRPTRRE